VTGFGRSATFIPRHGQLSLRDPLLPFATVRSPAQALDRSVRTPNSSLFNGTRNQILRLACTAARICACASIQADANAASLASGFET
jgi:hypothetical protein